MTINKNKLLEFNDPNYKEPNFNDVKAIRAKLGLTAVQLSLLLGLKVSKNGKTAVTRYEADPATSKEARQIDFSKWSLMLLYAGLIDTNTLIKRLNNVKSLSYSDICSSGK